MTHKLAIGINTYQDAAGLEQAINSVYDHAFVVIVVDGRYPSYGSESDPRYSTDNTIEICKGYDNVKYFDVFAEQTVKRTHYLKIAGKMECNFLLVVDADEMVMQTRENGWEQFHNILERNTIFKSGIAENGVQFCWNIRYMTEPNKFTSFARLIYHPEWLHYTNHWQLNINESNQPTTFDNIGGFYIEGITIMTDESFRTRSTTRVQKDIDYQWDLFRREGVITEQDFKDEVKKAQFSNRIVKEMMVWQEYYRGRNKK